MEPICYKLAEEICSTFHPKICSLGDSSSQRVPRKLLEKRILLLHSDLLLFAWLGQTFLRRICFFTRLITHHAVPSPWNEILAWCRTGAEQRQSCNCTGADKLPLCSAMNDVIFCQVLREGNWSTVYAEDGVYYEVLKTWLPVV